MAIAFFSVHHFLSVILLLTSTAIQAAAIFNADITTQSEYLNRSAFPQGFIFGTASSSYQVEGAANEGGREPSIWDTFTHKYPGKIYDGSNGDVAVDEYHHYKEDVEAMKDMNMDAYRFSISWSRILPKGRLSGGVNKEGINYYNNLINELLAKDIQPFVTIFHWDLPQALEDEYGGFLSPKIVNDFQDYAEVCFKEFGDRVKHWITLNEPWSYSNHGYAKGSYAPGRCSAWQNRSCTGGDSGTEPYIVTHHQLLAHAVAVNIYKTKYQASQKGLIGIALNCYWMVPLHDTELDKLAAQRALDFMLGWFMEPMTKGDYPSSMRSLVGSRLPKFSSYQSWLLRGSFDFIGLNYYTSYYAADAPELSKAKPSFLTDSLVALTSIDELNDPTLALEEALADKTRIDYYSIHLQYIQTAIKGGVNVKGYFAWSLIDNFEWDHGYTVRFGIYFVDYENGLKRHPKKSAIWFKNLLQREVPTYSNLR
ncbi:beta-glucosidase 12 isoform X2 [Arachis ipaensis]|uniref:beta-glucosidase 12 isoform X2 n=1 Tax=Arachis ipaensis TaxID=130454 RepID=UPI000A2B2C7F|nr:beta-glucosidase 12 isoform X2 [Arachis ipaensis]